MNPTELLPCPFCQSRAVGLKENEDHDTYWVECEDCEAQGPAMYEHQDGSYVGANLKRLAIIKWSHAERLAATPPAGEAEAFLSKRLYHSMPGSEDEFGNTHYIRKADVVGMLTEYAHAHTAQAVADCKRGLMEKVDMQIKESNDLIEDALTNPVLRDIAFHQRTAMELFRAWLAGE